MKKVTYFMLVHDGGAGDGGFWCEFPDLTGCMTDGDDFDDLMKNARDAMTSWLEAAEERKLNIHAPSNAETIKKKSDECEEPVLFVVPVTGYLGDETIRINVTAPESKIAEITAFAKKVGRTRSELMVDTTLDYIRANA
jgi:predicted RNase H-like HicB family nuclease